MRDSGARADRQDAARRVNAGCGACAPRVAASTDAALSRHLAAVSSRHGSPVPRSKRSRRAPPNSLSRHRQASRTTGVRASIVAAIAACTETTAAAAGSDIRPSKPRPPSPGPDAKARAERKRHEQDGRVSARSSADRDGTLEPAGRRCATKAAEPTPGWSRIRRRSGSAKPKRLARAASDRWRSVHGVASRRLRRCYPGASVSRARSGFEQSASPKGTLGQDSTLAAQRDGAGVARQAVEGRAVEAGEAFELVERAGGSKASAYSSSA